MSNSLNLDKLNCDVLVVGSGPGGYVAAIRAAQAGLDTVLVEKKRLGGTCLIRGCIPSKALIEAASHYQSACNVADGTSVHGISAGKPKLDFNQTIAWKNGITDQLSNGVAGLLKKAGVRVVDGWAVFENAKTCAVGDLKIKAQTVILANGSVVTEIPSLPFGGNVISSTEALDLETVPEHLAVVGAGYIGMELGLAYRKLGAKVTFIEAGDRILPGFDKALIAPVKKAAKDLGVTIHTKSMASSVKDVGKTCTLTFKDKDDKEQTLAADKVLVTVGRRPATSGWGLENMAIDMDGPFVKTDEHCRTSMSGVYAIGDLAGEPMLAHKATAQAEVVGEILAGHKRTFSPAAIPAVCYTNPEIVSVGMTPDEAKASGEDVAEGKFRFAANGRALSMGSAQDGGFVRVLALQDTGRIVGIQAVGSHVSELSGEFALAIEMCATLEDLAGTIHAHPTLSEAVMEAALAGLGTPLHSA